MAVVCGLFPVLTWVSEWWGQSLQRGSRSRLFADTGLESLALAYLTEVRAIALFWAGGIPG